MKAVGNYILVRKEKEESISKTKGGLLLAGSQKQDIRYKKAEVLSCGELVPGINSGDKIYYDMHAGHPIDIHDKNLYVITARDVVAVL